MTRSLSQSEFVFGEYRADLRQELVEFWELHGPSYREEMRAFRAARGQAPEVIDQLQMPQPQQQQVAAISKDGQGAVMGFIWVTLREVETDLNLGRYAYFQQMYIAPNARQLLSSRHLYEIFLRGFVESIDKRDHRAGALIAENINPGMQTPAFRRYLARLGYQMLGFNPLGYDTWCMRLQSRFIF